MLISPPFRESPSLLLAPTRVLPLPPLQDPRLEGRSGPASGPADHTERERYLFARRKQNIRASG